MRFGRNSINRPTDEIIFFKKFPVYEYHFQKLDNLLENKNQNPRLELNTHILCYVKVQYSIYLWRYKKWLERNLNNQIIDIIKHKSSESSKPIFIPVKGVPSRSYLPSDLIKFD